ncbi:MAG TPA: hypothetical protein VFZ53_09165, partial [Polyangiaceae bacterium]
MTADGDRASGRGSFARRFAVTALVTLIFLAGERVTAPGVDVSAFDGVSEFSPKTFSIFALGLTPALSAYLTVEVVALLVPRWRPLRHAWPTGRRKLDRAVFVLTVVLAAFQAFGMVMMLRGMPVERSALVGLHGDSMFGLTVLGGACCALLLAALISRQGIVNGVVVLALVAAFEESVRVAAPWLRTLDASRVASELVPVLGALVVLAIASFVSFGAKPDTLPAIALPASSLHPVSIAVAALALPSAVAAFGVTPVEVEYALTFPRIRMLVLVLVTLASGAVLAYLFNRPAAVGEFLAKVLEGAKPGAGEVWTRKAREALGVA